MNKRLGLAAITLGVGTLVSASAFAQGYYAPPRARVVVQTPTVVVQQPGFQGRMMRPGQDPRVFSQRVQLRVQNIANDLQRDVQRGRTAPEALNVLQRQEQRIQWRVQQASADGFIAPRERQQVMRQVDRLDRIGDQYRVRRFGGGPRIIISR